MSAITLNKSSFVLPRISATFALIRGKTYMSQLRQEGLASGSKDRVKSWMKK
jgi:hypothetical protein